MLEPGMVVWPVIPALRRLRQEDVELEPSWWKEGGREEGKKEGRKEKKRKEKKKEKNAKLSSRVQRIKYKI
jgi:hypothetical protein